MENIFYKKIRKKIDFDLLNVILMVQILVMDSKIIIKIDRHLSWLKNSQQRMKTKIVIKRRPNDKLDKNNF